MLSREPITQARSLNDLRIDIEVPSLLPDPNNRLRVYVDEGVIPALTNEASVNEGGASYHPSFDPAPEQRNLRMVGGAISNSKTDFTTPAFKGPEHQPESYRGPLHAVGDGVIRQLDEQLRTLPNESTAEAITPQGDETNDNADRETTQEKKTQEEKTQNEHQDKVEFDEEAMLSNENESAGLPHGADDTIAQRSTCASKSTSKTNTNQYRNDHRRPT